MTRSALPSLALVALASICASCAAPPGPAVDVVVDPPSAPSAAPSPPALCVAATQDAESRAFFRAYLGDAIVLKFSEDFENHTDVESLLLANGATRAAPFLSEGALLETDRLSAPIVASGGDLSDLEPYLRSGSIAKMGPTDVAIAESAAARLAIGLGSRVTLVRDPSPGFTFMAGKKQPRPTELRVAAILRVPGDAIHHYGERTIFMTLEGLRAVGVETSPSPMGPPPPSDATTGVRVIGDSRLAPKWSEVLNAERPSPPNYRVLTMGELADPGYELARGSAVAVCAPDARSGPLVPAAPRPDTLRPCDDLGQLSVSKEARVAFFGHGYVVGTDAAKAEEKAKARGAVRVDRGVVLNGAVATGAGVRFATIDGLDERRRAILAAHVVRGELSRLAPSRGVALSADLAAALGVDVGGEIVVHATPEVTEDTSTYRAWRATVVALTKLPAEAVHRVGLDWVWADEAVVRSEWSLSSDMFNVVRIQWPSAPDEAPLVAMMADGITLRSPLDAPNRMDLHLLESICPH